MGEHVVDIEALLHKGQVLRDIQVVLLAEIRQLQPVLVVAMLGEAVGAGAGQDVDPVDVCLLRHALIGRHEILVDLLPQVVVAPVLTVDVHLDNHMILIEDALPFRQGRGHDIPQSGGGEVAVRAPQQ